MYTSCQKEIYDIENVFEHTNKVIEELKNKIRFYISIEKDLKLYEGKVLNIKIQKYFEAKYPHHRFYYSTRHNYYYLYITPDTENQHRLRYDICIAQSEEKITRYKHDYFLKQIESYKIKLNEYTSKIDKITEAVMKYNMAYKWFKQADQDLYNAIPEMYAFDSKRYY